KDTEEHARRACGRKNRLALSHARWPAQRGAGSCIWVKRRRLRRRTTALNERPDYAPIASSLAVRVGDNVSVIWGIRTGDVGVETVCLFRRPFPGNGPQLN